MANNILISDQNFERLQRIARPLVDDVDAVIGRLLDQWEGAPASTKAANENPNEYFVTDRGEKLKVGLQLRALYLGKIYDAIVHKEGILIDGTYCGTPSGAAMRVKTTAGKLGGAKLTNGWTFWSYVDQQSGRFERLNKLRS